MLEKGVANVSEELKEEGPKKVTSTACLRFIA
jgi:hypothetical protein